jgi:hypothetical protein
MAAYGWNVKTFYAVRKICTGQWTHAPEVSAPEFHNMALLPSLLTNTKASDNIKNNTFFKMENRRMPRKVCDLCLM